MNRFEVFKRLAWSVLVVCAVSLGMSGCEGDDGRDGADGLDGLAGVPGADGQSCWDLNGNGVGDLPGEDTNGDGVVDVNDCSAGADFVAAAVESAQIESCGTCHGDAGAYHQAEYDKYTDADAYTLTFDNLAVVAAAVGFDLTLDFTITKDGAPYIDPVGASPSVDSLSIYIAEYDSAAGEFYNSAGGFAFGLSASNAASNGDGTYTLTQNVAVDPTAFGGGAIMGRLANDVLDTEDDNYMPAAGRRVRMYADYAAAAWPIGDIGAFESAANVEACEACHGAPYRKHGNSPGVVAGAPDFTYCRGCHNNTAAGGHPEWQQEQDDPFGWATDAPLTPEQTARFAYERTLQQDVHMSHGLHLPYPQSMATCNTCHAGKLAQVLDNSYFQWETCQGCHAIDGIDAWPDDLTGSGDPGPYYQANRAPAFGYLWRRGSDLTFHETLLAGDCTGCHGNPAVGAPAFSAYHNGYDASIYDATGQRYADLYTVSIDDIAWAGDLMTVTFSSSDPAVVPELLVSFYGWDTKHFLVGSHERDANVTGCAGRRPGCKMEYVPESSGGGANPLFTEDAASVPGAWIVTLDVSLLQLYPEKTDLLPTLIANGDITKAEVSITPELNLGGTDVVLLGVNQTFDLVSGMMIDNYFNGTAEAVSTAKCNACHDTLASSFHPASGRGADGIEVCKHCHTTTFPGSHLEMQSRSIDSYVHGIHSFQAFDIGDVDFTDPVEAKRYEAHIHHKFPYFTALACEGCHTDDAVAGEVRYNVPDQSESMPGVLAATDSVATRSVGSVPEYVTGPASRACGSCHRAVMLNEDHAGELASFNAHTEAFGTYVKNDTEDDEGTPVDDEILFGIVDKIMTLFE